jgi:hypothetical protein
MTQLNTLLPLLGRTPWGGSILGGTGFPVTQDAVTFVPEPPAPDEGVRRDDTSHPLYGGGYGPFPPYDGYAGPHFPVYGCPGSFGGFDSAPALSVPVMWAMRATPAIILASFYLTFAPACSAGFAIDITDDGGDPKLSDQVKAAAIQDLLPMWDRALPGACESLHFGNWLQEVVWGRKEDRGAAGATEPGRPANPSTRIVPVDVRPVLPMEALLHRDQYLRFTGFQIANQFRAPAYAFLAVNQPHIDPVRGYSRNQNALRDWWRSIQSDLNADRTERKASGIHMMLGVPDMTMKYVNPSTGATETITGPQMAQRIADQASRANVFTTGRSWFTREEVKNNPALADIKAVTVDQFDWGNIGEALTAHLKRLDRLDVNMVRAWAHGEREGMEAEHGSRADAMAHKSGGVLDCEQVRKNLAEQWDAQVGATWQRQNFPQWQGRFKTKPAPLADPVQEFLQQMVTTLLGGVQTGPDTEIELDKRALLERTSAPLRPIEEVDKDRQQRAADKQQQQAAQAKAGMNGNGFNGNGQDRVKQMTNRLAKRLRGD